MPCQSVQSRVKHRPPSPWFECKPSNGPELREGITAVQNKVEAYNGFAQWVFFGGEGIIAQNDPEEQEKKVIYNDLVATAVAIQNVVDMSVALQGLIEDGFPLTREDVAA